MTSYQDPGRGLRRDSVTTLLSDDRTDDRSQRSRDLRAMSFDDGAASLSPGASAAPVQLKPSSLPTSNQLIALAGAPKKDKGVGKLKKRMSGNYKAILQALGAYHTAAETTAIDAANIGTQLRATMYPLIEAVITAAGDYLSGHDVGDERHETIQEVLNSATIEKRLLTSLIRRIVRENEGGLDGRTFRDVFENYSADGSLVIPGGTVVTTPGGPGVESTTKSAADYFTDFDPAASGKNVLTNKKGTIAKGTPVIVFDTDLPAVKKVQTYKTKKENDEDKFDGVTDEGYAFSSKLKTSKYTHKEVGTDAPLFPKKPSTEDINQQLIGDCYFVAALGSIVASNPDMIHSMIKDNRDGTVTVRLFDTTQTPPVPRYMQLDKSIISHDRHSAGALWVPLLEKAYASMGINSDGHAGSASYAQMGAGGHSHVAFGVLTGSVGAQVNAPSGDDDLGIAEGGSIKPWSRGEVFKRLKHKGQVAKGQDEMADNTLKGMKSYWIFKQAFPDDEAQLMDAMDRWLDFINTSVDEGGEQKTIAELLSAGTMTRIEDFRALFTKHNCPGDIAAIVLPLAEKFYPGRRGTGVYTETQNALFTRIETHLAAGRFVAAGTEERVAKRTEGRGRSGGEHKAKGMVGSHAYSILGTSTKGGRKFVIVRNPWGDLNDDGHGYGRVYKEKGGGKLGVEADEAVLAQKRSATFELELSDVTKRFKDLYFS